MEVTARHGPGSEKVISGEVIEACPVCGGEGRFSARRRDLQFDRKETYVYAVCRQCSAFYQTPMPTAEKIATFYPPEYDAYEPPGPQKKISGLEQAVLGSRYGYPSRQRSRTWRLIGWLVGFFRYRDVVPFSPGGRALDVGCGSGRFVRTLNTLGWQAEGIDFSANAVRAAREAGIPVRQGALEDAGFEADSFDLISARHLIEHLADPAEFVAMVHNLLKPGGTFLIRTPNAKALARPLFGAEWFPDEIPRHLVLYSPQNLNRLLNGAGFAKRLVRSFTTPKFILNSWDYKTSNTGRPSRKRKFRRLLARLYVLVAKLAPMRGDEIYAVYTKV